MWFGSDDIGRDGIFGSGTEQIVRFESRTEQIPLRAWTRLPGSHNLQNAMAAACAAILAGADLDAVRRGLENFQPLPHRLEFVGTVGDRKFYNDSLATTPESAVVALDAFSDPIVLMVGGYDKQIDLTPLAEAVARKVKAVALMGQTADALSWLLESLPGVDRLPMQECQSFEEAFTWTVNQSEPGDVVLLSPGCASYDWFRNYAERGERFSELVRTWSPAMAQG
jgi:UDP-N-acetylmuramoylalanine--D-glutamate ligase